MADAAEPQSDDDDRTERDRRREIGERFVRPERHGRAARALHDHGARLRAQARGEFGDPRPGSPLRQGGGPRIGGPRVPHVFAIRARHEARGAFRIALLLSANTRLHGLHDQRRGAVVARKRANPAVTRVLPTSVSVPVMK